VDCWVQHSRRPSFSLPDPCKGVDETVRGPGTEREETNAMLGLMQDDDKG